MPDDEQQQREQEEQANREREEQEARERENAERYQREQEQRDLEEQQRLQEENSKESEEKQKEAQKEENSNHGPVFDEQKAISRHNEIDKLYHEVPLPQRFLSHFVPDSWTHAGRMRKAVQQSQRMMERGINGNDLGSKNSDPNLSPRDKVIADYKDNHAKFEKEYNELSGARRFFGRLLPRSWTKAGQLRTDMEMNDKFLKEKVILQKGEMKDLKKEAVNVQKNVDAAPLAKEENVKEATENQKAADPVQKDAKETTLNEETNEKEVAEKEEIGRNSEKTADLQERLKEDTASELNSSQEHYQEEMAAQKAIDMQNEQNMEMSNGSK